MRHYYISDARQVASFEESMPIPLDGEVVVQLTYTALSPGSNLFVYRTGPHKGSSDHGRKEVLYMGSGIVTAVGPGVSRLAPGDRVAMTGVGHQEFVAISADQAHRLPDGLNLRDASLAYLSSWAVSALHLGRYEAAETVVVVGQGLVGASAALVADHMGARVLALEVNPARAQFARQLGLTAVEEPGTAGAAERITHWLGDNGPDLILETSGSWRGFQQAVVLARDWTRIAIMGIYRELPAAELGLELFTMLTGFPSKFHYQRLHIIGCGSDPDDVVAPNPRLATKGTNFAYVLEQAARGRLALGRLVTHCFPAGDIGTVLARMADGDMSMVGVVFDWGSPGGQQEAASIEPGWASDDLSGRA